MFKTTYEHFFSDFETRMLSVLHSLAQKCSNNNNYIFSKLLGY